MIILLTGATGIVGGPLMKKLSGEGHLVMALYRKSKKNKLTQEENVEWVAGDLQNPEIFLDTKGRIKNLLENVEVVVHLAGTNAMTATIEDALMANVVGLQNILQFSRGLNKLKQFHLLSSYTVSGTSEGPFTEEMLNIGQDFKSPIGKSKFEAEKILQQFPFEKNIKKIIYRAGIIIGDLQHGKFNKVDGPYHFLNFLSGLRSKKTLINSLKYLPLPFDKKALLPFCPCDQVCDAIDSIINHGPSESLKFDGVYRLHLVPDKAESVQSFVQKSFKAFGFDVTILPFVSGSVGNVIADKLGMPKEIMPYIHTKGSISNKLTHDAKIPQIKAFDEYENNFFKGALKKFKEKK